jgi:hypothetical protein
MLNSGTGLFRIRKVCAVVEQNLPISLAAFTGQWIGETQGCVMPAHIWEISQQGDYLSLVTRWEDETTYAHFTAQLVPGELAFQIFGLAHGKAILVDRQHFVIFGWCMCNKSWDDVSPTFDVIFSRPGIAELTARAVYQKYLEQH